jgi:hypothetical protein
VDTALGYVQQHAAYSRAGVNGVRQVDTHGLIIAGFEHRMSREQDPNMHTHAVVANRVVCADGRWRTVDGRAVYAASVGARAVYEQALETELAERLGVRFSVGERRTIREVHGIPLAVIELFSKRRTSIAHAMISAIDGQPTAAGDDSDPTAELGARENAERTTDQDDGDDEVHPAIGLETVPENSRFEVIRHGPVVAPGPYRVEESHDAGDAQHRPGEEPPATTFFFHDTFPFLGTCCPAATGFMRTSRRLGRILDQSG